MKTADLIGSALDWAVASAEGVIYHGLAWSNYSTNWAQGGPIIEREGIRLHRSHTGEWWAGSEADPQRPVNGPTPLVAAMRCYVTSKLGNDVNVPEVL